MNGIKSGKYTPSSVIKTEPLTDTYIVEENIGRGKFAVVKKCIHKETKDVVAAKFIRKRRKGKSAREEILREVVMLEMAMAHPRLVDLLEVYETSSELILITEYCAGGELFNECVIEESFKEVDVIKLVIQILEGLVFLHEQNIVHLDLKPQNILLTKPFPDGSIKICDLGFACLVHKGEDIRDIIGTADYVAPEVLDYEPLNIMTDMWSMGVLTYVMLTAFSPFAGDNQQETFCNISTVKLDFPDDLFEDKSKHCQDFISKLLVKNARKRLTARQCLEHPWIKSYVVQSNLPPTVSNSNKEDTVTETIEEVKVEEGSKFKHEETSDKENMEIECPVLSENHNNSLSNGVGVKLESDKLTKICPAENTEKQNNISCDTPSIEVIENQTNQIKINSTQASENGKNSEISVSQVTYSVNKMIVLKPTKPALPPKPKFKDKPNTLLPEQSDITQFSKTFEQKTELSSPTSDQNDINGMVNGSNKQDNPFNDAYVMTSNKYLRHSLPGRTVECLKNKDKDDSFKRRSMEIPVKRLRCENEEMNELFSQNETNVSSSGC